MNIAVFHNLPSGGAKRVLHGLVRHWTRLGCAVDVFVPSTADEAFLRLRPLVRTITVEPVGMTVAGFMRSALRYLPPPVPYRISLGDLEGAQRRLADRINSGNFDVAFVEQDGYTVSPFVLQFLVTPSVYYCQQPCRLEEVAAFRQREPGWTRAARAAVERYAARRVAAVDRSNARFARTILVNSHFSRESVRKAYGRDAAVCYLGVDLELFRPATRTREDVVVSVGYLGPLKGHDFVVAALGRIPARRRPRLVVVANVVEPVWRDHVASLAAAAGVQLEVRSAVSDAAMVDLYRSAKLFVYAAHREPFGLAPLEAMACGTPVVAVADGGVCETVVDGDTGILTERSEAVFADAVETLLANDVRRARMADRAIAATRERWSMAQAAERVTDHLGRVARSGHATSLRDVGLTG